MLESLESLVAKGINQVIRHGATVQGATGSVLSADRHQRAQLQEYYAPLIAASNFRQNHINPGTIQSFVADLIDAGRCLWSYHADYKAVPEEDLDENQSIYWWAKERYGWTLPLLGLHRDPDDPDFFVGTLFDDALTLAYEFDLPLDRSTGCARVTFPYSEIKILARKLLDRGYDVSISDYQHSEEELNEPDPEDDPDYEPSLGGRADPAPGPCGGTPRCHFSFLAASRNEISETEKGYRKCLVLARIVAQKYRAYKPPEPLEIEVITL